MSQDNKSYIRWFKDLSLSDVSEVGGKNASLGEMYRELNAQGVRVPNGFATTSGAYMETLDNANAWPKLHKVLDGVDKSDVRDLAARAHQAREIVYRAMDSAALRESILEAYHALQDEYGGDLSVAVRSSATAEDLPTASFAGQHDTYLNIHGDEMLVDACRRCFASLFTDRAIAYRIDQGFDHFKIALSVGVMKMVRSDLATSGVMFSLDTDSGFRDVVFITGAHGLGENVVQGMVDPDEFYVHKPTFRAGNRAVLRRVLGEKKIKMQYSQRRSGETTRNVPTSQAERSHFCISDDDVMTLVDYAIKVEDHYSRKAGHDMPMDMEWAKDGKDGELYLVQARPETVMSQRHTLQLEEYHLKTPGDLLVNGRAVGSKIATGRARIIQNVEQLVAFQPGDVLVADSTMPDWGPVMKTAAAVVTNRGGRTCHAAIVARELGIPAVVGTENGTQKIKDGEQITVSCAEGDAGRVYAGEIPYEVETIDISQLARPRTQIMMNLANPELAFKYSFLPNDGVGLARMEFIITEYIRAHPMALIHPEKIENPEERDEIMRLTRSYDTPREFFVERLSEGVGTIAAAFYPKPVVVRMSDFKSNEYAALLGGSAFEPKEENPMIGFRGASRYAHPAYEEGFALECQAMLRVRNEMGLTNVKLMIPFCRRIDEGQRVLAVMEKNGLTRGDNGLEVYVMCEIPNNVIMIDAFAELFDGFSIGSNDLTQLTLGVDRDSDLVAFDFDERDAGVMEMIRMAVKGAQRNHCHSGICGQGPSDYPEIAEKLVVFGIDSMSLNPDTIIKTTQRILETEKALERSGD